MDDRKYGIKYLSKDVCKEGRGWNMNKQLVFNNFVKMAQEDNNYYTFGTPSQVGVIEDVLAYFGIGYKLESGTSSMHRNELNILQEFILNQATDEQILLLHNLTNGECKTPEMNPVSEMSGKVFISMPMNKDKCMFVDIIRQGIKNALKDTGNESYFLDLDVHNDNIYNKMMEEIRSCKFLIGDLTSQNAGVYYETGYARALGKTVIFTCKDTDFDNVHFDIKQTQIVVWSNEDELRKKLCNQIDSSKLGRSI